MDSLNMFLRACADGNIQIVTKLIDDGFNLDSANEENITGLQMAAANGQEEVVKLLIVKGASLDKANVFRWTPLHHAARHGHTRIAAALLQSQVDLNARNSLGCDVLTLAARGGHVDMCNLLIEAGIDTSHGVISKGPTDPGCDFTPLMVSALLSHEVLCKNLLERGAGVDVRCPPLGVSPLMLASMNSDEKLVKIFIEKGSNPDLTDINGRTALDYSICCSNKQLQSYLSQITTCKPRIETDECRPDIIEAVKRGNLQRVREILDLDICQRDATQCEDGATPLMFAAIAGRLDITQILVEKGCNINKQDTINGWTALMQSIFHGKKLVAKYLIDLGADVTIQANNGCTAFDMVTLLDEVDTDLYRILASIVSVFSPQKTSEKSDTLSSNKSKYSLNMKKSRPALKNWWTRISERFKKLNKGQPIYMDGYKMKSYENSSFSETESTQKLSTKVFNGLGTLKVTGSPGSVLSYVTDTESVAGSYHTMRSLQDLDMKSTKINENFILTQSFSFQNPPMFPNDRLQMPPIKDVWSSSILGAERKETTYLYFFVQRECVPELFSQITEFLQLSWENAHYSLGVYR